MRLLGPTTFCEGHLSFPVAGRRISGDMSNSTAASRLVFQTTTANSFTIIGAIPNGTVPNGSVSAQIRLDDNTSSATGSGSIGAISLLQGTELRIASGASGSGAFLPLVTYVGGFKNTEQPAAGGLLVTGGALGYGTGIGGTVTQATSKSTAVTLNKPCGRITTHNASLPGGTSVAFTLNNSLIGTDDVVHVQCSSPQNYKVRAGLAAAGSVAIYIENITVSGLSDGLTITFIVLKGVAS